MSRKAGKTGKIGWIIAGVLVGVLLIAFIFISSRIGAIAVSALEKLTEEKSGGLYELRIEKAKFNLFSGKIKIKEASLAPDTSVLNNLYAQESAPATIFYIDLASFRVKLSHWWRSLKSKEFAIEYLDARAPHIVMVQDTALLRRQRERANDYAKDSTTRLFSSLKMNKIVVKEGIFELKTAQTPDSAALMADGIDVDVDGLAWDSAFSYKNLTIPYWKGAEISAENISYTFPGEHMRLEVNRFMFSDKESFLSWDSLALIPLHGKYEYARKTPRQTDWMTIQTKKVDFIGFDLRELFSDNYLRIEKIFVDDFYFSSFKNRKVPPIVPPVKPLFHRLIHKIPFDFYAPDITFDAGTAEYEELALHAQEPGKITFTDIRLFFDGLTNRPTEAHQCVKIDGKTDVMGKGGLSAIFELPLHPDDQNFKITGQVAEFDLRSVNPMIKPMSHIFIERGDADRIYFTIMGTDNVASVDYLLLYHDLKVGILDKEGYKTGLASKIVNDYVLIPDNPEGNKAQRSVRAFVVRDIHRSNFQFWWSAIFAGTKETIGFTKEMEADLKSLQSLGEKLKEDFSKRHR